ncbi:hypothetical protein ACP70R_019817 [Stipagrostis hirtigluma subsp. patula]
MVGAVVTVSMGAMNTLLPKLTDLIEREYKHLSSVKPGITFMRDELSSMNALLAKLANNEERLDEQAKEWRDKVRELSYDFEDAIDLFIHKLKTGDANANIVKKTARKIKKLWSRHKIANLIQELKDRVKEESDRRLRYKLDESVANMMSTVQIDPRLPAIYEEADRLVGIDGPREEIIEWLMKDDSTKQLKVVSIVGFGGLGKTTLANQVHKEIKNQFDCTAFVPVSRSPNIKKILTDMLKESNGCVDTSDDERQLIGKLRSHLQCKRYLIIVDDIWSIEAWQIVKSALPENNLCSKIITTTRHADVAKSCWSNFEGYIYNIQPLSDKDSQKLFCKRVFRSECQPPHLEEVCQAIIKKCQGLPLAIITVASLLASKNSDAKDQWELVKDSMVSAMNSKDVGNILLLSYYDLPYYLKTCFLYLSVFPEDYEINRKRLIWMWIAEGFITEMKGQSLEQIGESYFNDLINRSLIQPVNIIFDGRAEACRVHDMVLDLIISLSTRQNFATIVEGQASKCSAAKVRRLSLLSNCVGNEVIQDIVEKCSRVFFQLKYLEIKTDGITELPDQIGDLQNLQTLDISGSHVKKLPPTVGGLQNLVRLLLHYNTHFPDEVGDLQALQVLSNAYCYNSVDFMGQLRRLTNLSDPSISLHGSAEVDDIGRYQEAVESSLILLGKHRLKSLNIQVDRYYPAADELMELLCCNAPYLQKLICFGLTGVVSRLPQGMASLVSLVQVAINVKKIRQEDLCILGGMPTLLYVCLYSQQAPDERVTILSQQFSCVKQFMFLSDGPGGLRMVFQQEAMPKLRRLTLCFSAKEAESSEMGFEFSFEHLASLEHLSVTIDCRGGPARSRVEAAEATIRNAASIHAGHPTLEIERRLEQYIVEDHTLETKRRLEESIVEDPMVDFKRRLEEYFAEFENVNSIAQDDLYGS